MHFLNSDRESDKSFKWDISPGEKASVFVIDNSLTHYTNERLISLGSLVIYALAFVSYIRLSLNACQRQKRSHTGQKMEITPIAVS